MPESEQTLKLKACSERLRLRSDHAKFLFQLSEVFLLPEERYAGQPFRLHHQALLSANSTSAGPFFYRVGVQ